MRKKLVTMFFMSAVTIGTVVTFLMQPTYKSTSTIQIQNVENQILPFDNNSAETLQKEYYPTQYNILMSDSLAERVIEKLNLDSEVSLEKNFLASFIHSISAFFIKDSEGSKQGIPHIQEILQEKEPLEMRFGPSLLENEIKALSDTKVSAAGDIRKIQAIKDFNENLKIQPITSSQLVDISYHSPNPVLSAMVANTIADEYAKYMMEIRLNPVLEGKNRLEKEAKTMRSKLSDSEKALNTYLEENQFIFINDGKSENRSLFNLQISELSSEMNKAVADRISKEAIYQEVTKTGVEYGLVLDNPVIQTLTLKYAELEAEYVNLLKIHKPAYPKMRQIYKEIESLKRKIQEEELKILKALESDYAIAVKKEAFLSSAIESLRKDVTSYQQKMVHYHMLKGEVDTNKELYNLLLKKLKEVDIGTALAESNVQIINKAKTPQEPFKPSKSLNIMLSVFVGLFGGIFLAFTLEYFDHSVKDVDDIEQETRVPVLGAVPFTKIDSGKLIGNNSYEHNHFTEALRSFSTFIQFSNGPTPPKKILITSPLPSEGKTLLATHIAKNCLHFSGKGVIVDADMRRQGFHEILNVDNDSGLSSYLSGKAHLKDIIKKFPNPEFDTVTSGPTATNPSSLLNSYRMKKFVDHLSRKYDFVIIDSPPIVGIPDSLILSKYVDYVVVVVRASNTPRNALLRTIKLLKGVNANILGVLLNGINNHSRHAYSRYYTSYYEPDKTT
ncbi:MAG: polysaccharide biosynthesis tyrosine autokinase [Nitrospiraceae bacterium]|nr:MAG: polysaccharide biosynthesis tyrosine autokinase [Nitrospiraceae bacterium]